ncbi:nitrate- and nitrite sensing domain-containing protein [Actinomadura yumaensis]|uniref:histidine kinase n=1 Tax=Actinomadura yumaensis TaxID=111807 RepID=A0ABW2CMF0_9ACTN
MEGPPPDSGERPPASAEGNRGGTRRLRLRNWRVLARLVALIVIPTAVALAFGGLRVVSASSDAETYSRVERLTGLGGDITGLVHELGAERDLSAGYIAAGRPASNKARVQAQYAKVDQAAADVRRDATGVADAYGGKVATDARAVVNRLDGIAALRSLTMARVPQDTVIDKYSEALGEIITFLDGMAEGSAGQDLAEGTRALAALSRAKEQASRQRAVLFAAAIDGHLNSADLTLLLEARAQQNGYLAAFRDAATLQQRQEYDDTVTGRDVDQANEMRERALSFGVTGIGTAGSRLDLDPKYRRDSEPWRKAMTESIDKMRTVQEHLGDDLVAQAGREKKDAQQTALLQGAGVGLVLLLVLLLTFVVARSLVRPLRRLQEGALEVAGTRLPGLVDRLRDPEAAAGGIEVEPIDIDSTDEIGQVARAFDEVHREAVRLAADEAVLRGNINAMFVNLSRRSQSLIERQLKLIEDLEQSERDEEQLANLFRLDHLATRMRRNCENLLVLGGQDQARRWNQPVPLIDVVRASLSEVEQYERVALRVQGDMTVVGPVVNDLVHLLAELVENATAFSNENTKVTVSGQLLSGGGAMLQITDNGVGMPADELEQANWRLANPPVIDFSAARRMGLFVVGRLAVRHGIRVELRAAQGGGLTAFVVLPDAVVTPAEGGGIGGRGFGGREASLGGGSAPLASLTAVADPPAIGAGGAFRQPDAPDEYGTGGHPMFGATGGQPVLGSGATGGHRAFSDTGGHRGVNDTGGHRNLNDTGAHRGLNDTGSHRAPNDSGAYRGLNDTGGHRGVNDTGSHRNPNDTGGQRAFNDTGGHAGIGDTGGHRDLNDSGAYPGLNDTGGRPGLGGPGAPGGATGPLRPLRGGTGPQPAFGGTGPQPPVGDTGPRQRFGRDSGSLPAVGGTGPLPAVPPQGEPPHRDQDAPQGRLDDLPVREPGAQLPGRPFSGGGEAHDGPNGFFDPAGRQTGAQPAVPEAQPAVPEPRRPAPEANARQRPTWETGPLEQVPAEPAPEEPAPRRPAPRDEPSARDDAARAGQAAQAARAQRGGQGQEGPRRVPERSPIFDAMQSEWFMRRTGDGSPEDPVKGWESAADAGFRAAEAATREPVTDKRTAAGLPKRVPGKNRVPGAVAAQTPQARGQGAQAPGQAAAPQRQAQGRQGGPAPQQPPGQSADLVRNRFASLQRGVYRGRTETRGGGMTGDVPSQDDGETGGTR